MTTIRYGVTYVVTHPEYQSVKVGCTSNRSGRLAHLVRRGWVPYRTLSVATSGLAREIEQAALFQIRHRLHFPPHLPAEVFRDGWSETVSARLLPPVAAWQMVCEEAGALHLAPSFKRSGPQRPTPPRRRRGDTPAFHPAARAAARETAIASTPE